MYFFIPNLDTKKLDFPQTKHFFSMRKSVSDILLATDLKGSLAKIKLTKIDKKSKTIEFD